MKNLFPFICLFMIIGFAAGPGWGQNESKEKKPLKNTVRINLTNPIIFGDNYYVIGYERVIGKYQSASIGLGRYSIPKFVSINTGDLNIIKDYRDKGFHISGDYRFYLKNENRHMAPRGVYLGPYYSYNYFKRENTWSYHSDTFDGEITTDLTLNIQSVGVQLGYQFIFWRRLAVDLVLFGPGVGFYGAKIGFHTSLSPDEEAEFFKQLNDLLSDKFPGYNFVIGSTDLEKKGSFQLTSLGFRYMIHMGFRF